MNGPVSRFFPGQKLTTGDLNDLAAGVNAVRVPRGDETISVDQMGGSINVRDERPPVTPDQGALIYLDIESKPSPALGAGFYYGRVYTQAGSIVQDETAATLTMPKASPDANSCVFLNLSEAKAGTSGATGHTLAKDGYVIGYFIGYAAGGWPMYAGVTGSLMGSVSFRILASTGTAAQYTAHPYKPGTETASSYGTLDTSVTILVWNMVEVSGIGDGHMLTNAANTGAFGPDGTGYYAGVTDPGTGYAIVKTTMYYAGCGPALYTGTTPTDFSGGVAVD